MILRKIKLFFTPGVCSRHELRKNYYVGESLSGSYYICPQCMYNSVMEQFEEHGIDKSQAIPQRMKEFTDKIEAMKKEATL